MTNSELAGSDLKDVIPTEKYSLGDAESTIKDAKFVIEMAKLVIKYK